MMAPSPVACLGIVFATRAEPHPPRARAFRDRERILEALAHGAVTMDDTIAARHVPHGPRCVTTVGRFLVAECFPPIVRTTLPDGPWDAARIVEALRRTIWDEHVEVAGRSAEALEQLGRFVADRSGASLAQSDFAPPSVTTELLAEAQLAVAEVERAWHAGDIIRWDYENKRADLWANARTLQQEAAKTTASACDPLAALLASQSPNPGAESLRTMLGPCTLSSGTPRERPILHSLGEGLEPHEYMMRCMALRAEALHQRERDEEARVLGRRLGAALAPITMATRDCGTAQGIRVKGNPLARRIEGRVLACDVVSRDGTVLVRAGTLLSRQDAQRIDAAYVLSVILRDPVTCETPDGICARCFGLDPEDATWPAEGDKVGLRAAAAIAHAARSFRSRTFHIC